MNRRMFLTPYCNLCAAGVFASLLLLSSCQDEELLASGSHGDSVSFVTDAAKGWSELPQSRSGDAGNKSDTTYVVRLEDTPEGEPLYMHIHVADGIETSPETEQAIDTLLTRGAQLNSGEFHNTMKVFAQAFPANGSFDRNLKFNFMNHVKVSMNGNTGNTHYRWPGKHLKARFYAWTPHNDDVNQNKEGKPSGFEISAGHMSAHGCAPVLQLNFNNRERPVRPEDYQDIMFAQSEDLAGNTNAPVNLKFTHIMAAIRIKAGSKFEKGTISRIQFKNIHCAGRYIHDDKLTGGLPLSLIHILTLPTICSV